LPDAEDHDQVEEPSPSTTRNMIASRIGEGELDVA
jgi:hypothetical protein